MKRRILTIKQFDYESKEEFLQDIPKMKEQGYILIDENYGFGESFQHGAIDDWKYKYTAYFFLDELSK